MSIHTFALLPAPRAHTCLRLTHSVCTLSHASACPRDRIWAHSAEDGTEDSHSFTDGTADQLALTWTKSSTCTGGPSDVRGSVAMTPVPRPAYAAVHMADKRVSALMHSERPLVGGSALAQVRKVAEAHAGGGQQVAGRGMRRRRAAGGGRQAAGGRSHARMARTLRWLGLESPAGPEKLMRRLNSP